MTVLPLNDPLKDWKKMDWGLTNKGECQVLQRIFLSTKGNWKSCIWERKPPCITFPPIVGKAVGKQLCKKKQKQRKKKKHHPQSPGAHQADHASAACTSSKEGQEHCGKYSTKHHQQDEKMKKVTLAFWLFWCVIKLPSNYCKSYNCISYPV